MERQLKKPKLEVSSSNNIMEAPVTVGASSRGTFYKTIPIYSNNHIGIRELRLKLTVESVDVDPPTPLPPSASTDPEEEEEEAVDNNDDDCIYPIEYIDCSAKGKVKEETEICPVTVTTDALTNAVILANLATFLRIPDLLALRSVCTTWNSAFIPQLRARSSAKCIKFDDIAGLLSEKSFMATMENSLQVPFAKFHFNYAPVPGEEVPQLYYMKNLLKKYGHLFTHLKISFLIQGPGNQASRFNAALFTKIFNKCHELLELKVAYKRDVNWRFPAGGGVPLPPISFTFWDVYEDEVFPALKKLKKLQLSLSDTFDMITEDTEDFLNALYRIGPNLEELDLTNPVARPRAPDYNTSIITTLQNNKSDLRKLKSLKLHHLTPALFEVLNDLSLHHGLTLSKISLKDVHHQKPLAILADPAKLEKFLHLQSSCIKHLVIDLDFKKDGHGVGAAEHVLALSSFPTLEELKIYFKRNIIPIAPPAAIGMTHAPFTQLKKLHFEAFGREGLEEDGEVDEEVENCWNKFIEPLTATTPILTLRDLTITFGIYTMHQMTQLGLVAPNLTRLNIGLESLECIPLVWTQWPKLEILGISFTGFTGTNDDDDDGLLLDEVVTGIPVAVHPLLITFIGIDPMNALASFKTQPGISDCLRLTEFKLITRKTYASNYALSDISIYYGVGLPTSKLKNLHLSNSTRISSKCRDSLKQMLGAGAKISLG